MDHKWPNQYAVHQCENAVYCQDDCGSRHTMCHGFDFQVIRTPAGVDYGVSGEGTQDAPD